MRAIYDLPASTQASFPKHGWVMHSNGVKFLRLPILRLFQFEPPFHEIYSQAGVGGVWLQSRSPYSSLRQLAVSLRELNAEVRSAIDILNEEWTDKPVSVERDLALTRYREGTERVEILLIAAFVILRRLADHLIDAVRPVLFHNWQSAPRQLKSAITAAEAGTLVGLKPRFNLELLVEALVERTSWFEDLRQEDGIRDILVHKEHILQVGGQGSRASGDERTIWHVSAQITYWKGGKLKVVDSLSVLRKCVRGMCEFMETIYSSVNSAETYERGDFVFLTGDDADVTGFWPAIFTDDECDTGLN